MDQSGVTATSIPVSWTSGGSEGVSYQLQWTYTGSCDGTNGDSTSGISERSQTIEELEEYSSYSITVTASNSLTSSAVSTAVSGNTSEASMSVIGIAFLAHVSVPLQYLLLLRRMCLSPANPPPSLSSGAQYLVLTRMDPSLATQ